MSEQGTCLARARPRVPSLVLQKKIGETRQVSTEGQSDLQDVHSTTHGPPCKRKAVLTHTGVQDIENTVLREVSQTQKDKPCGFSSMRDPGKPRSENENTMAASRGWGREMQGDLTQTAFQFYKTGVWSWAVVILYHVNVTHIHQVSTQKG